MNTQNFDYNVSRLKDVYGEKAYSDERVKLLWRDVCELSGEWFEGVVDSLIKNSRYAPLGGEFSDFISQEKNRLWNLKKETQDDRQQISYKCEFCSDKGVYLATQNSDRSKPYAFRCHCATGCSDLRKEIPHYKQIHADQGFKFYGIGWAHP